MPTQADLSLPALNPSNLKNRYIAARHGHSRANQESIIISTPQNGFTAYGLTPKGKAEVKSSVQKAYEQQMIDSKAIILTSPFARTRETAQIIQNTLQKSVHRGVPSLNLQSALMERNFGDLEKTSNSNYHTVWEEDTKNPGHTLHKVESVNSVLSRILKLIEEKEEQYEGETFLFISHGDPLQILETWFGGIPAANHRSLPPLKTGEIRPLNFTAPHA